MAFNRNETNQSLLFGCNGDVEQTIHPSESVLMGVAMILIIMVSWFGNSLVILAIYKYEKLRNITNTLLCSLAVADLLSPIFRVTFISISNLTGSWIFGCSWCTASSQIGIFFCAASIAHLCVITLERYIKIVYPYRHNMWLSKRSAYITVIIIWLVSVGLAVLPFIFKSKIDLRFNRNILYCEVYLVRNPYLSIIMSSIFFAFPFLVMIVAYYHIFLVAHQQNQKMSVCSIGSKATKNKRLMRQEWKTVKTVVIVLGVFFILWSPYFIFAVIDAYHPGSSYWVKRFALCCAYLNTCCNWIVYCVLNKELRACFMKLLNIKIKLSNKDLNRNVSYQVPRDNPAYDNNSDGLVVVGDARKDTNDETTSLEDSSRFTSEISSPPNNDTSTLPQWQKTIQASVISEELSTTNKEVKNKHDDQ